jgi:hypothetical protein
MAIPVPASTVHLILFSLLFFADDLIKWVHKIYSVPSLREKIYSADISFLLCILKQYEAEVDTYQQLLRAVY